MTPYVTVDVQPGLLALLAHRARLDAAHADPCARAAAAPLVTACRQPAQHLLHGLATDPTNPALCGTVEQALRRRRRAGTGRALTSGTAGERRPRRAKPF